ncbi:U-box domain-containing protein 4 [Auxenochlorella protothecoides]|uniref:U-box domain-containing protein 4 n=1 Tax=Auxenochlorella protothecoides TaxID=3075 RepID=A0A087SH32_AUXPR|nr:U-box domain-containing protein 4 [Auxenochlorella protothecoides]KFM25036.1 U-box domain-containing protein 4 [Auxenochlorella protothecoides]
MAGLDATVAMCRAIRKAAFASKTEVEDLRTVARFVGKVQLILEGLRSVEGLDALRAWPEAHGLDATVAMCRAIRKAAFASKTEVEDLRTVARFVGKVQLILEGLRSVEGLDALRAWPEAHASLQDALQGVADVVDATASMGSLQAVLVTEDTEVRLGACLKELGSALAELAACAGDAPPDVAQDAARVPRQIAGATFAPRPGTDLLTWQLLRGLTLAGVGRGDRAALGAQLRAALRLVSLGREGLGVWLEREVLALRAASVAARAAGDVVLAFFCHQVLMCLLAAGTGAWDWLEEPVAGEGCAQDGAPLADPSEAAEALASARTTPAASACLGEATPPGQGTPPGAGKGSGGAEGQGVSEEPLSRADEGRASSNVMAHPVADLTDPADIVDGASPGPAPGNAPGKGEAPDLALGGSGALGSGGHARSEGALPNGCAAEEESGPPPPRLPGSAALSRSAVAALASDLRADGWPDAELDFDADDVAGAVAALASPSLLRQWVAAVALEAGAEAGGELWRAAAAALGLVPATLRALRGARDPALRGVLAGVLRQLARDTAQRRAVAEAGGIAVLAGLLQSPSSHARQAAARALSNVVVNSGKNKLEAAQFGAIHSLARMLETDGAMGREAAAATLGNLAANCEATSALLAEAGAVAPLADLLASGTPMAVQHAARALRNLAGRDGRNKRLAAQDAVVAAGAVPGLLSLLAAFEDGDSADPSAAAAAEAAAWALSNLCGSEGARRAVCAEAGAILGPVVAALSGGSPGARHAAARLLKALVAGDTSAAWRREAIAAGAAVPLDSADPSAAAAAEAAAWALSNLCGSEGARRAVCAEAGAILGPVVAALSGGQATQAAAAAALGALACEDEAEALRAAAALALWDLCFDCEAGRLAVLNADGAPCLVQANGDGAGPTEEGGEEGGVGPAASRVSDGGLLASLAATEVL